MVILLALLLSVGIVIMVALVFIGYMLYVKSKKAETVNDVIASKESDLIDLYCSLEQIMNEIEVHSQQIKTELATDYDEMKALSQEIRSIIQVGEKPADQQGYQGDKVLSLDQQRTSKQENLLKEYERSMDLKGNKIKAYYRKGLSVTEIAKVMGIGQGEVQLILNLNKNNGVQKMI